MCASLCYNSVGMTALKIFICIFLFDHCGTSPMPAHFIETPVGVATVYYNYVCRHAGVLGEVNSF